MLAHNKKKPPPDRGSALLQTSVIADRAKHWERFKWRDQIAHTQCPATPSAAALFFKEVPLLVPFQRFSVSHWNLVVTPANGELDAVLLFFFMKADTVSTGEHQYIHNIISK